MIRLTRWSVGAVALTFALAAVPARAAEVDKLLPPESEAAVYLNFRQVLESELVKKFALEQLKQCSPGRTPRRSSRPSASTRSRTSTAW